MYYLAVVTSILMASFSPFPFSVHTHFRSTLLVWFVFFPFFVLSSFLVVKIFISSWYRDLEPNYIVWLVIYGPMIELERPHTRGAYIISSLFRSILAAFILSINRWEYHIVKGFQMQSTGITLRKKRTNTSNEKKSKPMFSGVFLSVCVLLDDET